MRQYTYKKNYLGEMLIIQIIEVELRGSGPPRRTWTSTMVIL